MPSFNALVNGGQMEIRGFGAFTPNYRPPPTGRNLKTGAVVSVPEKFVSHFTGGKVLRERVDGNKTSAL